MTKFALILSLFLVSNPLTYVSEVNDTQREALNAFNNKEYLLAVYRYQHLVVELKVKDLNIYMNLAHTYYKLKQWQKAYELYQILTKCKDRKLISLAYHQLGMIAEINYQQDKYKSTSNLEIALKQFKLAIINNPANYEARYNFELISKKLEKLFKEQNKNKPTPNDQNKSGDKKTKSGGRKQKNAQNDGDGDKEVRRSLKEASKDGKDKINEAGSEGEKKGVGNDKDKTNKLRPDQLKAININQEKIKTIFEAMKNKEIHYLQQKRRRNKRGKKGYNKSKPDW